MKPESGSININIKPIKTVKFAAPRVAHTGLMGSYRADRSERVVQAKVRIWIPYMRILNESTDQKCNHTLCPQRWTSKNDTQDASRRKLHHPYKCMKRAMGKCKHLNATAQILDAPSSLEQRTVGIHDSCQSHMYSITGNTVWDDMGTSRQHEHYL